MSIDGTRRFAVGQIGMRYWCVIVNIITYIFSCGCEREAGTRTNVQSTQRELYTLCDSAQYHLEVSEEFDRTIHFLKQIRPHCQNSSDLQLRYTSILTQVAWRSENYQDVLTASSGSLCDVSVRGETRTGTDANQTLMSAHALKKLGDTSAAIRLYEVLAASEYLAMRRGAQANLLTLYSKCGNYSRAIELAQILEPTELTSPADLAAHINREYYWGRSLHLAGNHKDGDLHLRKLIAYIGGARTNTNTTELRVRLQTARNMLADGFLERNSGQTAKRIANQLRRSIQLDSIEMLNLFGKQERVTTRNKLTIPYELLVQSANPPLLMKLATLDTAVITSKVTDERGAAWYATLYGLYIQVGQQLARVEIPNHKGLVRPIRSLSVSARELVVGAYTGVQWRIPIDSLVANYSAELPYAPFYRVKSRGLSQTFDSEPVRLRLNDSTTIIGGSENAYLLINSGKVVTRTDVPDSHSASDTVLSIFGIGDSIVITTRFAGPRCIRREQLAKRIFDFVPFDANKMLYDMALPKAVTEIAAKHAIGEYPETSISVYDELYPTSLQRILFLKKDYAVILRNSSILLASQSRKKLQIVAWPDSIRQSLEQGYFPSMTSDSTIRISTRRHTIDIDLHALQNRPLAKCLVAVESSGKRKLWVGWLHEGQDPLPTGDSLTLALGSKSIISDYLDAFALLPSWSGDSIQAPVARLHQLDVPNVRSCSIQVGAPGVIAMSSINLTPKIHTLLYQDVWILITVVLSAMGAIGVIAYWHRIAATGRDMLERQHSSIARDLHDTLGADLARLTALLNASETRQSRDIANAALAANRKFRSLLWIWRSDSIRLIDFAGEIREYVAACLSDADIECTGILPEHCDDHFVDATIAKNILIILNESITNVIRHSRATHADLSFTFSNRSCTISFADNGIGFDVHTVARSSGINNIPVRAVQSGFIAQVMSEPNAGTTILISFGVH